MYLGHAEAYFVSDLEGVCLFLSLRVPLEAVEDTSPTELLQ